MKLSSLDAGIEIIAATPFFRNTAAAANLPAA